ncbi:hypothetical protein M3Y94_00421900 [Aphelenchoides besseyi]|nr:hypothetical protein M3Y94_00421900 [Aphelenchoides besseyi]
MFVRQLYFVVVLAMVSLTHGDEGFKEPDKSTILDLNDSYEANTTLQLTGSTLVIGISNAPINLTATNITFILGSCTFKASGYDVFLPAEARYDGSVVLIRGYPPGTYLARWACSTEIKKDVKLDVRVKASRRIPVVLTFHAPFPDPPTDNTWTWITIGLAITTSIIVIGAITGGTIWGVKHIRSTNTTPVVA